MARIRFSEHVVLVAHILVDWNYPNWNHPYYEGSELTLRRVCNVKLSDVSEHVDQWLIDAKKRYPNAREVCLENWYIETV